MSAKLDRNAATGKAAVFSVRESMWHREGIVVENAPNLDEAVRLAGIGYEVALKPLFLQSADGTLVESPTGKAVVRLDRYPSPSAVLAVVGDSYVPLQNVDGLEVLRPLVDKGLAQFTTGGSLRGGRDAWMQVRFNITDPVVQEAFADEVVPYGTFVNNHSSDRRATLLNTPVRIVCANTLRAAMGGSGERIAVRHTGDARVRLIEAAEQLWGAIVERHRALADEFKAMRERILTVEEFTASVLSVCAPLPEKPEGTADANALRGYERALNLATFRRSVIERAWYEGTGHKGDRSAWEAYNGAVEVLDHNEQAFKVSGSRLASLLDGALATRKAETYSAVLALCRN